MEESKLITYISDEQSRKIKNLEGKVKNLQAKKIIIIKKSITINDLEEEKILNKGDDVKTPEILISKKLIINPLTKDNKSFLDSIKLSLHHKTIGKNNTRPTKIRKYSDTFNWENINFPPTGEDYKQLEIINK